MDIKELEQVFEFAKKNRISKLKYKDIELDLHPTSFETKPIVDEKIEVTPEMAERINAEYKKQQEELTYWSGV